MTKGQTRRVSLARLIAQQWPQWGPAGIESAICAGEIVVEGRVLTNPRAQVRVDAAVRHEPRVDLAGRRKLGWAIERFAVDVPRRTALDVGASTGGFTTAWLASGARRVFAVDVGHGQLLGSLRQDDRVVSLERTNVADLSASLVGDPIDLVSVDVSYLALRTAVAQLGNVTVVPGAVLLGLVKPMFELRLPTIPTDRPTLSRACEKAAAGVDDAGWVVTELDECPVRGGRGAIEFFLHASRR